MYALRETLRRSSEDVGSAHHRVPQLWQHCKAPDQWRRGSDFKEQFVVRKRRAFMQSGLIVLQPYGWMLRWKLRRELILLIEQCAALDRSKFSFAASQMLTPLHGFTGHATVNPSFVKFLLQPDHLHHAQINTDKPPQLPG